MQPRLGDIIGEKFRLDAALGEGGFAIVYAATDVRLERRVALKVLKPDRSGGYDESTLVRFRREIEAVGRLTDPHTVTMYEHGETDQGAPWVAFEHVPGRDLKEVLQESGRLDPKVVEHILRQLLSSLQEAHQLGLIHRDIKPDNVRVFDKRGDPWTVKLLDFGIARPMMRGGADATEEGHVIGTPRYMSPEQLTEKPLTPASDLYSLGVVVFEMLVGSDALHGEAFWDQIDRLRTGHMFAVPEVDPRGVALHEIVRKMTARDPDERFQQARDVLTALDAIEHGQTRPIRSTDGPSAPRPRGTSTARLSTSTLGVLAAALLALIVVLGLLVALIRRSNEPSPPTPPGTPPAELLRVKDEAAKPPGRQKTTEADVSADPTPVNLPEGCGEQPETGRYTTLRWTTLSGRQRIDAYVPKSYDPHRVHPVITVLHEGEQTAREMFQEVQQELQPIAEREGVVLVFPEGDVVGEKPFRGEVFRRSKPWVGNYRARAHEAVQTLHEGLCVDRDRIFLLGHGRGGGAAEKIAAKGGYAGLVVSSHTPRPHEPHREPEVPMLLLAALQDQQWSERELSDGCGGKHISLEERENRHRRVRSCGPKRRVHHKVGSTTCYHWDCEPVFVSCHIDGGPHWPGSRPAQRRCKSPPPGDFAYGEEIWRFLSSL